MEEKLCADQDLIAEEVCSTKVCSTWKSPNCGSNKDYTVNKPVFTYKDYAIYHLFGENYLYTFEDKAFSELAGLNKQHLIDVAERKGKGFLYWRAIENLKKHGLEQDNPNDYIDEN